jgi:hypothetical protein
VIRRPMLVHVAGEDNGVFYAALGDARQDPVT